MVRNTEKIMKIECPKRIRKIHTETIEVISQPLELNLTNIEPYAESRITAHIDLNLDQLEDPEE